MALGKVRTTNDEVRSGKAFGIRRRAWVQLSAPGPMKISSASPSNGLALNGLALTVLSGALASPRAAGRFRSNSNGASSHP